MEFSRKRGVRLSGSTQQEKTREEVLEEARAQRRARERSRQQSRGAVSIQRHWRGYRCRKRLFQAWHDTLLKDYAAKAASPDVLLPARQLLDGMVPLMLAVVLRPGGRRAAGDVLRGKALPADQLHSTAALRGSVALLLRSVAAEEADLNFAALFDHPELGERALRQACAICSICAGALASPATEGDELLQTACAQLIRSLLDSTACKAWSVRHAEALLPEDSVQRGSGSPRPAAQRLRNLAALRVPGLFSAAARVLQAAAAAGEQRGGADSGTSGGKLLASRIQQLLATSTTLLLNADEPQAVQQSRIAWTQHVLACPHLLPGLPPSAAGLLRSEAVIDASIRSINACCSSADTATAATAAPHAAAAPPAGSSDSCLLAPLEAAWVTANLAGLLMGTREMKRGGEGSRTIRLHVPSALLDSPPRAAALLTTVAALVTTVQAGAASRPRAQRPDSDAALAGWELLFEQPLLAKLLDNPDSQRGRQQLQRVVYLSNLLLSGERVAGAIGASAAAQAALQRRLLNVLAFSPDFLPRLWALAADQLGLQPELSLEQAGQLAAVRVARAGLPSLGPGALGAVSLLCQVYSHLLVILDDADFYERQVPFRLTHQRAIAAGLNMFVFSTFLPNGRSPASHSASSPTGRLPRSCQLAATLLRSLYIRDSRRSFCPVKMWLLPYRNTQWGPAPAPEMQRAFPAVLARAQGLVRGEGPPLSGPRFSGSAVVRSLMSSNPDSLAAQGPGGMRGDSDGMASCRESEPASPQALMYGPPAVLSRLLLMAPQCVPYEHRVELLRELIAEDKRRGWGLPVAEGGPAPVLFVVHRARLMEDAVANLGGLGERIKGQLHVTFVNEGGMREAGIDLGGLLKELLLEIMKIGMNEDYGLFTSTPDGLAYPSPNAMRLDGGRALLHFLGLVFGKALYEGILLDAPLALFFITRLQGLQPSFDDLALLDPELHRSLLQIKHYPGDVEELGLDFTVEEESLGARTTHELRPGGAAQAVTNDNRLLYVALLADWHLNQRLLPVVRAFASGVHQVIPQTWLRLFAPKEVNELLAGGADDSVDLEDMRAFTRYSGGYSSDSATVRLFWRVVASFNADERKSLLKFVTSCSRAPLGGFRHLQPPLTLQKVPCQASVFAAIGGRDVDRLPSASTCFNMLKLPNYRRYSTLRQKLLYAIRSGTGFELS